MSEIAQTDKSTLDTTSPYEAQPAGRSRWAAVRAGLGRVRGEILTAGVRNPRGQGQNAGNVVIAHHEGKPFDEITYAPQTTVNTCEEIFAFYPLQMLENPAFRGNIEEDQWQPQQ